MRMSGRWQRTLMLTPVIDRLKNKRREQLMKEKTAKRILRKLQANIVRANSGAIKFNPSTEKLIKKCGGVLLKNA